MYYNNLKGDNLVLTKILEKKSSKIGISELEFSLPELKNCPCKNH